MDFKYNRYQYVQTVFELKQKLECERFTISHSDAASGMPQNSHGLVLAVVWDLNISIGTARTNKSWAYIVKLEHKPNSSAGTWIHYATIQIKVEWGADVNVNQLPRSSRSGKLH